MSDVSSNDSKVTILQFPDIRAIMAADTLVPSLLRTRSDSFYKSHGHYVTSVTYVVNGLPTYFLVVKTNKSYTDLCEQIVDLLRKEREKQGLSKYAVEQRCGISQQMIGYVERGLRKPSLETALRIADGLGLDLSLVITEARKLAARRKH